MAHQRSSNSPFEVDTSVRPSLQLNNPFSPNMPSTLVPVNSKGKNRAAPITLGPVIELTDSDSDSDSDTMTSLSQHSSSSQDRLQLSPGRATSHIRRGRERLQSPHLSPTASGSASVSNPGGPSWRNEPLSETPLFLPSPAHNEGEDASESVFTLIPTESHRHPLHRDPTSWPRVESQNQEALQTFDAGTVHLDLEIDPIDTTTARIRDILPDVEPEYLRDLVMTHLPDFGLRTVEHVLGLLVEGPSYPRAQKKRKRDLEIVHDEKNDGKGKERAQEIGEVDYDAEDDELSGAERPKKLLKVDYSSLDRPSSTSHEYLALTMYHLQSSFPHIPKSYIRSTLGRFKSLYAPTHIALASAEAKYNASLPSERRPYTKRPRLYDKGGANQERIRDCNSSTFAEERHWLVNNLELLGQAGGLSDEAAQRVDKGKGKAVDVGIDQGEPLEDGNDIECQCCFAEYSFANMVQCPEAHLFCSTCVSQYAATQLGSHNSRLVCMHSSGCAQPFPVSELRRVLPSKLIELYERVVQQAEIDAAELEGLEQCPFCEWKCVIEVGTDEEKLFRCQNDDGGCGEVSCRTCKKKDHLPKSCKEAEEDKHIDGRLAIEEAMTRALTRNCPKCQKPFIKESGCNKMTCPNCQTFSCYVCRQIITGYDHFEEMGRPSGSTSTSKKCPAQDNNYDRHAAEVKAAAEKAIEEYKREHPDVDEAEIKVDIPVATTFPIPPLRAHYRHPRRAHFQHALRGHFRHPPRNIAAPPPMWMAPDVQHGQPMPALIQEHQRQRQDEWPMNYFQMNLQQRMAQNQPPANIEGVRQNEAVRQQFMLDAQVPAGYIPPALMERGLYLRHDMQEANIQWQHQWMRAQTQVAPEFEVQPMYDGHAGFGPAPLQFNAYGENPANGLPLVYDGYYRQ